VWIDEFWQLERIQNPLLYKQFRAQKKIVKKSLSPGTQLTRRLFHGTSEDVCEKIYTNGFDRSFAGKNGKCNRTVCFQQCLRH